LLHKQSFASCFSFNPNPSRIINTVGFLLIIISSFFLKFCCFLFIWKPQQTLLQKYLHKLRHSVLFFSHISFTVYSNTRCGNLLHKIQDTLFFSGIFYQRSDTALLNTRQETKIYLIGICMNHHLR